MDLVRALGPDQPFYGLQVPKVAGGDASYDSVDAMATAYLEAIQARQPQGPYMLGGWSMGATVAFEIARRLVAAGQQVSALQLIDGLAPGTTLEIDTSTGAILRLFARDIGLAPNELPANGLRDCTADEGVEHVYQQGIADGHLPPHLKQEDLALRFSVSQQNFQAMCQYQAQAYSGPVSVYKATTPLEEHRGAPDDMGWSIWAQTVVCHTTLPGDHFSIMHQDGIAILARELKAIIQGSS
jgi:thioesterase domain-containing protein